MSKLALDVFIERATPIMLTKLSERKLIPACQSLAVNFLRTMYDNDELKPTIEESCSEAIFAATVYFANGQGIDPFLS